MGEVRAVTDSEFEATIGENGWVLVDFWAAWCGPCRALAPIFEAAAEDHHEKIIFAKIDIDDNPQTPSKYGVKRIPT